MTPYPDADLLPLSAVQHWLFCRRQCALIHLERLWAENRLTAQGRTLHDRTHTGPGETRGDCLILRALPLRSMALGLTGIADVVECHRTDDPAAPHLPGRRGRWRLLPVEYKRGRPKANRCDEVQLCAQAMALEEMLQTHIPEGALFYGQARRRKTVCIDTALRDLTTAAAEELHEMIRKGITPPAEPSHRCRSCSLAEVCLPEQTTAKRSARRYLQRALDAAVMPITGTNDDENP